MGTVTRIADHRTDSSSTRLADIAATAYMHPAFRWHAGDDRTVAHRRTPMGRTACGAPGDIRVADATTPLCEFCYPPDIA